MEPIISPWLIYGIEMLSSLKFTIELVIILSAFLGMLTIIIDESLNGTRRTLIRLSAVVFIITGVAYIVIPSRETAYKMLMASYITPNNVHTVGKETNEAVGVLLDNITNHMKELKDNK